MTRQQQERSRGSVVPFVRPAGGRTRSNSGATARPATARVASPAPGDPDRDAALNAEWDRLRELTSQACTWRDPESLAALEAVLVRLKRETLREWQG